MNRYAIVENGKVVNLVVGDQPLDSSWIANPPPQVQIGWLYSNGNFSAPLVYTLANASIKAGGIQLQPFAGNYYCQPGNNIELIASIMDANGPVTSITVPVALKMPLVRHANGMPTTDEVYLNVTLINGVMTATGVIESSGDWKILIDRNNEALKRIGVAWKLAASDVTFLV